MSKAWMIIVVGLTFAATPMNSWAKRQPAADKSNSLKQSFLDKTQLRESDLKLIDDQLDPASKFPKNCTDSDIQVIEVDGEVIVELGAHAFVRGIGKSSGTTVDRECKTTFAVATVETGKVSGGRLEICKGRPKRNYSNSIQAIHGGLITTQIIQEYDEVSKKYNDIMNEVCKYSYQN